MKNLFLTLLFVSSIILVSCSDSDDAANTKGASLLTSGIYEGSFSHISPDGNKKTTAVSVTLNSDGTYSSSAGENYFPAGSSGNYSIVDQKATFNNPNFYTAHFDWNYLLSGVYQISQKDNTIKMSKATEDNNRYEYDLVKK